MIYDAWLEHQRERHEVPDGYCQCGEPAEVAHYRNGRIVRLCADHNQEPPEADE